MAKARRRNEVIWKQEAWNYRENNEEKKYSYAWKLGSIV